MQPGCSEGGGGGVDRMVKTGSWSASASHGGWTQVVCAWREDLEERGAAQGHFRTCQRAILRWLLVPGVVSGS